MLGDGTWLLTWCDETGWSAAVYDRENLIGRGNSELVGTVELKPFGAASVLTFTPEAK